MRKLNLVRCLVAIVSEKFTNHISKYLHNCEKYYSSLQLSKVGANGLFGARAMRMARRSVLGHA